MAYNDPRNLAISPSPFPFPPQVDAFGRPIHPPPFYHYSTHRQSPPPGLSDQGPPFSSPPEQNRGGISIRGRANRGRNKGRSRKHNNPNLIDIGPRQPSADAEYDPANPGLVLENSNVNDIPISNARNRLRDRIRSPSPQDSLERRPPPQLSPEPASTTDPEPEHQREPESSPKGLPLENLLRQMAANGAPPTPTGPAATHGHQGQRIRRLPNHVQIADAYMFQQTIDERLRKVGVTPAREDALRLAGVQWIDQTRKALKLPVRTFDTACVYYHKFRLAHGDNEYAFVDASAAALFTACKIEDTLKKSRDILCAAHNAKAPSRSDHLSPDDPSFDAPSRAIVGTERLILEASGFDFRSRHPQTLLVKFLKANGHQKGSDVANTAWKISIDLYRTLAPLKMSTAAMALACVELAERLTDSLVEAKQQEVERKYKRWGIRREMVLETLLDLLDLYTSYRTSTALGSSLPLDAFLNVRIPLNEESARRRLPRYTEYIEIEQPRGVDDGGYGRFANGNMANGGNSGRSSKNTSPKDVSPGNLNVPGTGGSGSTVATAASTHAGGAAGQGANIRQRAGDRGREGTVRFMLNPDREREERAAVAEYGLR